MLKELSRLVRIVSLALLAMAVVQELQKPKEERAWEGRVLGFVPYDLRFPTLDRFMHRMWNPADPRIFTEHPFGVGWVVNIPSLLALVQGLAERRRDRDAAL